MLLEGQRTAEHAAEVAVHGQMELGVVVFDGLEQASDGDVRFQLLAYLATQSLLGRLAGLDLAAGKLPPVFPLAVATLRGEDASFGIADDCRHHFNLLHTVGIFP